MALKKTSVRGEAFQQVLGFTFRHWGRQPRRISLIVIFALLATLADVLTPLLAGRLVDAIASGPAADPTAWRASLTVFALLAGLGLGSVALRQLGILNITTLTLRMMSEVAAEAFHRVQRFSSDWHANSFAGSTVRKLTRGMWALDLLNDTLLIALFPCLVMLTGTTLLLALHWPLMGLLVGLGSLIYIAITVALSLGYVAPAARLSNAWDTKLGGALADAVSCNPVVKAFGAERREEARLARVMGKWQRRTRRTWMRTIVHGSTQGAMIVVIQLAIIGAGLLLWRSGRASVGDLTFVLTTFFVLQGYLRDVGMHIRNLQRSVNDMEELVAFERQPLGVSDVKGAQALTVREGEIRFENVTFRYDGHTEPLYEDFSIRIAAGERIGLIGHSGSGKTTFIKLIQRLYDVDAGRITIDGQDIAQMQQASLRGQIAIVQQEPLLFHRSLAENIAYARPDASRAEIMEAARLANAYEFIDALPKGFATLVGERGVKLSGGERQRVAIARAFLANAPILILDEATSSLDSESELLIQQAMERLMQGRTTLVIAHRLSTVRALDRLLVLDRGEVIEEGSHEQLIRRAGGTYRRLVERQALDLTDGLTLA